MKIEVGKTYRTQDGRVEKIMDFDADPGTSYPFQVERLQGELERFYPVYTAVNLMMNILGAGGEINTRQNAARAVLAALNDIDGGVYRSPDVNPARVKENKAND